MAKVLINDIEFDLISYYLHSTGVTVNVKDQDVTLADIEAAAGDLAVVRIANDVMLKDLTLKSISKEYSPIGETFFHVSFSTAGIKPQVDRNTDDIETIDGAIQELAEIISEITEGGEE